MKTLQNALIALVLAIAALVIAPHPAHAQVHVHPDENGTTVVRSLESLRDLDYQSWQAVAYRSGPPGGPVTLRLVGYPGKLRLDHPTSLVVYGGRRQWQLDDITTANPKLATDGRDAAAEFNLSPLLADLRKNRPLRLELSGVFVELPVPPFVVAEWRSLPSWRESDATRT